jgi:WD40 repeat protein
VKRSSVQLRPANYFVVSADGRLVAGINGADVLIFRVSDWSMLAKLKVPPTPTHPDIPMSVAISPDSRILVIGAGFGSIHVYRMGDVTPAHSFIGFPGGIFHYCGSLAFSPDGEYLATGRRGVSVGEADDGWVRIWRTRDWQDIIHLEGGSGSVRSLKWTANGSHLAAGDDRSLRVWRMGGSPPELEVRAQASSPVYSVAFSVNGILAAATGSVVDIYR